jgi:hypothetical protein
MDRIDIQSVPFQPLDSLSCVGVKNADSFVRRGCVDVMAVLGIGQLDDGTSVSSVDDVVVFTLAVHIPEIFDDETGLFVIILKPK